VFSTEVAGTPEPSVKSQLSILPFLPPWVSPTNVIGTPATVDPSAGEMLQDNGSGGGLAAPASSGASASSMLAVMVKNAALCRNRFIKSFVMIISPRIFNFLTSSLLQTEKQDRTHW
jgi:hypothetical protein